MFTHRGFEASRDHLSRKLDDYVIKLFLFWKYVRRTHGANLTDPPDVRQELLRIMELISLIANKYRNCFPYTANIYFIQIGRNITMDERCLLESAQTHHFFKNMEFRRAENGQN